MDFDRAQKTLEALCAQCPHTDAHDIDIWVSAVARAREALLALQIAEDRSRATAKATKRLSSPCGGERHDQDNARPLMVVGVVGAVGVVS
jgi:hypothetical protein